MSELQRFVIPSGVSLKVDLGYLEVDGTLRRMQYLFCALERELQERIAFRGGSVDDPITDESTAKIKRWFEEKERGQQALELLRSVRKFIDAMEVDCGQYPTSMSHCRCIHAVDSMLSTDKAKALLGEK